MKQSSWRMIIFLQALLTSWSPTYSVHVFPVLKRGFCAAAYTHVRLDSIFLYMKCYSSIYSCLLAESLRKPLRAYCHIQDIDLQAFWHFHSLLLECHRHSIVTPYHVAGLQLFLLIHKNTLICTMS